MIDWRIDTVLKAMTKAADIAIAFYEKPGTRIKSDRTLVTEADLQIENALCGIFENPADGSYLIGEETVHQKGRPYLESALDRVAWVVDPIDGTAPYAHHIPTWGISIARMERSVISDGAIYLPITGEVFITQHDGILHGIAHQNELTESDLAPLNVIRREPDEGGMIAITQSFAKRGYIDSPNPVQALACAVMPLSYLLLGRYLGYVGTLKLWDIAGALALLSNADFHCTMIDGTIVGRRVTNEKYAIDHNDPHKRWQMTDLCVCGSSKPVTDYLISCLPTAGGAPPESPNQR